MIPYLRETGFKMRLRFDWKGHGLGKAAKLAKWTVLFVLANQAGVIVVTQLATAARRGLAGQRHRLHRLRQRPADLGPAAGHHHGLPDGRAAAAHLARSAHDGDAGAVRDDISQGLRTSAVAIVPIAFGFVALGIPMCTLIFGSSGTTEATNMGFMLMAFGLGLIPYSVQYVVLRAFYAYEDTRTPFYNTVIVAAVNADGLRPLLLRAPGPLGRGRHGRLVRPRVRDRRRRRLEPAAQAARRRPRRHPRPADVRPAGHRLGAGRARSAARPATASATLWARASAAPSPPWSAAVSSCSSSSTSPHVVCASKS